MAYDPKLEKVIKTEDLDLGEGIIMQFKIYSYNGGPKTFKTLVKGEGRRGEWVSSKFPGITDPKALVKIAKKMSEFAKEL